MNNSLDDESYLQVKSRYKIQHPIFCAKFDYSPGSGSSASTATPQDIVSLPPTSPAPSAVPAPRGPLPSSQLPLLPDESEDEAVQQEQDRSIKHRHLGSKTILSCTEVRLGLGYFE